MLRTALVAAIVVGFGAAQAAACGFKAIETAQTPVPPVAEAPAPVPSDMTKDVADAEAKAPATKVN
jgi:hypothetical protein